MCLCERAPVVLLALFRLVSVLDAVAMVDFLQLGEGIDFADVVERAFLYGYTVVVSADDAGNIVPEALLGLVIRVEACRQVDGELRTVFFGPVADAVHVVAIASPLVQVRDDAIFGLKAPVGRFVYWYAHVAGLVVVLFDERRVSQVQIAFEYISVAEVVFRNACRRDVVRAGVDGVFKQGHHGVVALQQLEALLFVSCDDINLGNICGEQCTEQGFDNALPIDIYERFRRVDGYGQHAASESACKQYGALGAIRLKCRKVICRGCSCFVFRFQLAELLKCQFAHR